MRSTLLTIALCLWAASATAQVVNPTTVQFDPSADHNALNSQGQPVVVRYDLQFYPISDLSTPVRVVSLGKPAPGSDGTIQLDFSTLTPWPLPNGSYQARVVAIGQTGNGISDLSNVFSFQTSGNLPVAPTNVIIK
jgi:hypothetical protein